MILKDRSASGALTALLLLGMAMGCTGSAAPRFDAGELSPGSCRDMGTQLVDVERTQRELLAGKTDAKAAAAGYAATQDRLIEVYQADPDVAEPVRALVTALGIFRIGVDAGSLADSHAEAVRTSLADVVTRCGVDLS